MQSESFRVHSGVRQSGVLSPHLFAVYMDDLILKLKSSQNGCHIANLLLSCIVYADDIYLPLSAASISFVIIT